MIRMRGLYITISSQAAKQQNTSTYNSTINLSAPVLGTDRDPLAALMRAVYGETGSSKTTEDVGLARRAGQVSFCDIRGEDAGPADGGRPDPGIDFQCIKRISGCQG